MEKYRNLLQGMIDSERIGSYAALFKKVKSLKLKLPLRLGFCPSCNPEKLLPRTNWNLSDICDDCKIERKNRRLSK